MITFARNSQHNKGDLRIDDLPVPHPGPNEVLLKTSFSGICGSEVHEYVAGPIFIPLEPHPLTGKAAPQTLGHEFGGEVVELGRDVRGLRIGDRVAVNPILACGACRACGRGRPSLCEKLAYYGLIGDGGHAEFAVVRATNCVTVSKEALGECVAFGEPAAVAFHAINRAQVRPGSSVAIVGGGPIGQLAAQFATAAGASKVFLSEIANDRLDLARRIGAVTKVFNSVDADVVAQILDETDGQGVDIAIECSGGVRKGMMRDPAVQAVDMTRANGTTVLVGTFTGTTEIHLNTLVLMERQVLGSWVWNSQAEYSEAMQMIVDGKIKVLPLISRKVRIDRAFEDGVRELHINRDHHMKILVDFT